MKVPRTIWGLLALGVLSCASSPDRSPAPTPPEEPVQPPTLDVVMRDLTPRAGRPLFLGVSPRLHNREDEVNLALLHAAEQASRYTRMFARYRFVTQRGGGAVGYLDDIQADWDAAFADELVQRVEALETFRDEQGTYVVATVDGIPPAPVVEIDTLHGPGEPEWVSRPPVIPGFIVTVGATRRSRRIRDSLDTADQDALKEILLQAQSTVRMIEDRRDIDRVGTLETTTAAQEAEAVLRQFLVLARYAPPDGGYYYSLVVAREE
ncbi:MAG: hypothetical protein EA427_06250 [Spirochaetaceae bacterium]|nr:MAG: hypothetical protein EA427_06250 [Spirochaetaceae bacterium]